MNYIDFKMYGAAIKTTKFYLLYGSGEGVYRVLVGKPEGRNHWGDLGVDGRIILGWISRKWDVCIRTGLGWPRIETGGGPL